MEFRVIRPFCRYPGGKSRHTAKILRYFLSDEKDYREPFIGGGSVYLASGFNHAWINDIDQGVYDLWRLVKTDPESLIEMLKNHTEIIQHFKEPQRIKKAIGLWRSIQDDVHHDLVPAGYRFIFLNKTCFNGVQSGGPTGGMHQTGDYNLASRWSLNTTIKRIREANTVMQDCQVTNVDWLEVVKDANKNTAVYLDPPYLEKGSQCYEFAFTEEQHASLAKWAAETPARYVITVDDCELIRTIYQGQGISPDQMITETWFYSMSDYRDNNREGKELFIADPRSMEWMKSNTPKKQIMKEIF